MTQARDDGGLAFPALKTMLMREHQREPHRFTYDAAYEGGMTLRDWFAGQALLGMTASPALMELVTSKADGGDGLPFERMARKAYEQADAMLAARSK
jgi:hypothetical protein